MIMMHRQCILMISPSLSIYTYIYIERERERSLRGGEVPLTEILVPRTARRGTLCVITTRGARAVRIDTFELDEGLQPYHPPFRTLALAARALGSYCHYCCYYQYQYDSYCDQQYEYDSCYHWCYYQSRPPFPKYVNRL